MTSSQFRDTIDEALTAQAQEMAAIADRRDRKIAAKAEEWER